MSALVSKEDIKTKGTNVLINFLRNHSVYIEIINANQPDSSPYEMYGKGDKRNLLQLVVDSRHPYIIISLENSELLNFKDERYKNIFFGYCDNNNLLGIKTLGPYMSQIDINIGLIHLCEGQNLYPVESVKYLLSKGADINTSYGDKTPLIVAVMRGNYYFVEYLISVGADMQVTYHGYPLAFLARRQEMLKVLLGNHHYGNMKELIDYYRNENLPHLAEYLERHQS